MFSPPVAVGILALCLSLFSPKQASAQCETGGGADADNLIAEDVANLNLLIIQEESFQFIMVTAYYDLLNYYRLYPDH